MRFFVTPHWLSLLISFFLAFCLACTAPKQEALVIATAANMQFAMEELVEAFSKATQIPCETVVSSSGKLTAQIQAGAPFDIFVSADRVYPERLHEAGLTSAAPKIYAYGQLVLWTTSDEITPSIEELLSDNVQHIALANPKTAPYGQAAEQVLRDHNIFEAVQSKLVYGESIAQTNQFIISGAAEIGFTAMSVVQSAPMATTGKWTTLPSESYLPIDQGVVVIPHGGSPKAGAEAFATFLLSEQAKDILDKFGYLTNVEVIE